MFESLSSYPVVVSFPIAWGDMDAQRHVNNVMYFRYMENARMAYYDRTGITRLMEESDLGTVLASTDCRYKSSLTYPDTVSVGARITTMEADRFTMEYRIVSHRTGAIAADGKGVIVMYDFRENRKTPIPKDLRAAIETLEGTVITPSPPP